MENLLSLTEEQIELINWLNKCTIGTWSINKKTKRVDIEGSFNCRGQGLKDFKGVKFGTVGGSFNCSHNELTSLEGGPKNIGKHFECHNNKLTSLEGAPKEVGGQFDCINNKITSLEGAPQKVGGGFVCSYNELTSLEGAPQVVGGSFECHHNKLISLDGAPREVKGSFYCGSNTISGGTLTLIHETMCEHNVPYIIALSILKDEIPTDDKLQLGLYKTHERAASIMTRFV